jgi:hypothetical protein
MEESRRSYYTIPEAAQLKGISEKELYDGMREGSIPYKRVGMRLMIPAVGVFDDLAKKVKMERGEKFLDQMRDDLLKVLEAAPEFGSCGIIVTFHSGIITKVTSHTEVTKLKGA